MFERYTEPARRVVFFTRYETSALGSPEIGPEHLLLGMLREGHGLAGRILKRAGVTPASVREAIETQARPPVATTVDVPLTAAAKRVLEHAMGEVDRSGAGSLDVPHLLLGLLREPDTLAGEVLHRHGLRLEEVREEVRLRGAGHRPAGAPPASVFDGVIAFLRELEARGVAHHVSLFRRSALRVEIALPEERWSVTFFADERTAVEVFSLAHGARSDDSLDRLLERLPPAEE